MKIAHWTLANGSGLHRVAEDLSLNERSMGHESKVIVSTDKAQWDEGMGADIHVSHSHIPDSVLKKDSKVVWVGHGTPEHCFQISVEQGLRGTYAPSDSFMVSQYWLQHADAVVTFWERHRAIWKTLCDRHTEVHCIPLGVDTDFWKPFAGRGRFAGSPSLFSAENCHYIKWPLDLFIMWPFITEELREARLHCHYVPSDQHRWWFPLVNRNGAYYRSFISGNRFNDAELLNAFNSVDYYIGLVRYGDFNRIALEAKASGTKVISYRGNPYADYWLTEGDQRIMAQELLEILRGNVKPRETVVIPDIGDTARAMIRIYERVLC